MKRKYKITFIGIGVGLLLAGAYHLYSQMPYEDLIINNSEVPKYSEDYFIPIIPSTDPKKLTK